jgi:phytol kinase
MFIVKASSILLFLTFALILINICGKRYHLNFEIQRKLLHIVLGLVSLSFPFVFETTFEVALLLLSAFFIQLSIRYIPLLRRTLGESIYGVNRSWVGAGLFLISILALFIYSNGDYALYAGPLLLVTFADAFAAIFGTQYGKKHYLILGNHKSVEGTIAFFVTAFFVLFFLLIFTSSHTLLLNIFISVVVAIFGAVAEFFSGRDLDNLTVPAVTFLVLQYLL